MSQFQRETRYAVFKLKNLTEEQKQRLYDFSMELGPYNSVKECVVVESDWPNYEDTWAAIQAVHNGCYVPAAQMPDGMTLLGRRITDLTAQLHEANKVIDHIALAVGCENDRMACWESVDAIIGASDNSFGDGFYEGFVAGGKLQEELDLNLKHEFGLAKFCDYALEASEDAEASRANISVPSQRKNLRTTHDTEVASKAISEFIMWATTNVDPEFAEWQDFANKYAAELRAKAGAA
jgi:hypothetical protein